MLLSYGCSTQKYVPKETRDSIVVIVRDTTFLRDTTLQYPIPKEDNVSVSDSSSYLETTFAESWASLSNGKLNHRLRNKDGVVPVKVSIPFRVRVQEETKYQHDIVIERVNYITPMQGFWIILAKILSAILVLVILLFYVKHKIKKGI